MKYIVAVSGGVDSVVLLDILVKSGDHELVVAHFDHGIREDSAADARFVGELANSYGLPFVSKREELGSGVSEAVARERRYKFLRAIASNHEATIVAAHHQDDVVETIAINLTRGTGWRGLAVMNDATIERPLSRLRKRDIYDYALGAELEWVEDSTNSSSAYLRNRIRKKLGLLDESNHTQVIGLYERQNELLQDIDYQAALLESSSRHFLTMIDETVALELLRHHLAKQSVSLTRPQRTRLLHAIKTARPGHVFEAGDGVRVEFTRREFIVKHPL